MTPRSLRTGAGIVLWMVLLAPCLGRRPAAQARDASAKALALEAQGKHPAALAVLWSAAGETPRDPDIQNGLGEALERIGALDAAITAYEHALDARPGFLRAANNLVLTLVKAGRGADAVRRARMLAAADPGNADRQFTLALALSEQDMDAALATLRRVVEANPRHALAQFNLGLVLKRADRRAEALEAFRRALDIAPRAEVHYQMGVLYWQQGDTARADAALRAAVAAAPDYADAYDTLGAVLAGRGDTPGAAAALRRAIAIRPGQASTHYTLGRVLRQAGDAAGAARAFDESDRLERRTRLERAAGVRTAVGVSLLQSGDLTGALDEFRRATTLLDTYAPAHYQIGVVLARLGQPQAAQAAFARAARLDPDLLPPPGP